MKSYARIMIIWTMVCILIWAPIHSMWLVPFLNQMLVSGEMTIGAVNIIGLYSSLFPLAFVAAVNYYAFVKGDF